MLSFGNYTFSVAQFKSLLLFIRAHAYLILKVHRKKQTLFESLFTATHNVLGEKKIRIWINMYITTLSARYKYTDVTDDSLPCGLKLSKDSVTV